MPYLSYQIDQHNTKNAGDDSVFKPNLKGFAVGNGVTNWDLDCNTAYVEMAYWHSLYSTELYEKIKAAKCNFGGPEMANATKECLEYFQEFSDLTNAVNIYDIYGICYGPYPHPQMYETNSSRKTYSAHDYTPWVKHRGTPSNELPPCTFGNPIMDYLNRDDVRHALHIPIEQKAWELCTEDIHYTV